MHSPQWIKRIATVCTIKNSIHYTRKAEVPIHFEATNTSSPASTHVAVSIANHSIEGVVWYNFILPPIDFLPGLHLDEGVLFSDALLPQ
jgi:hypothetical protein